MDTISRKGCVARGASHAFSNYHCGDDDHQNAEQEQKLLHIKSFSECRSDGCADDTGAGVEQRARETHIAVPHVPKSESVTVPVEGVSRKLERTIPKTKPVRWCKVTHGTWLELADLCPQQRDV